MSKDIQKVRPELEPVPVFVPIFIPIFVPEPAPAPLWPPCAFDNLPPGVYGLVCQCPRCSPSCTSP